MTSPSTQQGPLPFLTVSGNEVSNAARVLSYLRNGLANTMQGHWVLGSGDVCGVLYRLDSTSCTPTTFVSPAADPAPWYDPAETSSEDFLGFMLLGITGYDSTITRPVVQRFSGLSGGSFGSQQRTPRTWKFRGAMVSASDMGAEYGLRWLTSVLQTSECDTCATSNLSVRLTCPADDCSDDDNGLWTSYSVALTDGPHEVEPWGPAKLASTADALGSCRDYVIVEFTMVAANPFLYKPQEPCLTATIMPTTCSNICDFLFGGVTEVTACCDVTAPSQGVTGAVASFTADGTTDAGGAFIAYIPGCGSNEATAVIALSAIPAGSTVVVDSAQHQVTIEQNGVITDGTYLVSLTDGASIEWVEVRDCDPDGCFCVGPACFGAGTVSCVVTTQNRQG